MIPKKIHYCWFGENEKPLLVIECIKSWQKYCPDYEIMEWNSKNYDVHKNKYMEQAYQAKRWGFVSDYARLDIIYQYGGIYLDTDVELIRSLDDLLETDGYIGFEKKVDEECDEVYVNTGQGFGASAFHPVVKAMMDIYKEIDFAEKKKENLKTCPYYNTAALVKLGMKKENVEQEICKFHIYPAEYFCPINWKSHKCELTDNTYSIHHFEASWLTEKEKKKRQPTKLSIDCLSVWSKTISLLLLFSCCNFFCYNFTAFVITARWANSVWQFWFMTLWAFHNACSGQSGPCCSFSSCSCFRSFTWCYTHFLHLLSCFLQFRQNG